MKCSDGITHRPYIPANRIQDAKKPYICRLAPSEDGFLLSFFDNSSPDKDHTVFYGKRGADSFESIRSGAGDVTVSGLSADTEYEVYVSDDDGHKSNVRLVRTGKLPDGASVINYLHPDDTQYIFSGKFLCSPSLVRLPCGRLIAGMDVYGAKMGQNTEILFFSDDDGKSWHYLCELYPFYWATLFVHRGKLYIIGLSTEYGNLQISYSDDNGEHFSKITTIIYGANNFCATGGAHRAPMQVISHKGRLYTSVEYGSWESGSHLPAVISIDENDDLMTAENWHLTGFLPYEGKWKEETETQGNTMEGNIVKFKNGKLYNVMRWKRGEALLLSVNTENPDAWLIYEKVLKMPVTTSMFRILPYRDGHLLITNHKPDGEEFDSTHSYRNVLSVYYSNDFEKWIFIKDIVNYAHESDRYFGFQYPCVLIEGDTLSVLVRSAFNGAPSFHDSNYSLFFRFTLNEKEISKIEEIKR